MTETDVFRVNRKKKVEDLPNFFNAVKSKLKKGNTYFLKLEYGIISIPKETFAQCFSFHLSEFVDVVSISETDYYIEYKFIVKSDNFTNRQTSLALVGEVILNEADEHDLNFKSYSLSHYLLDQTLAVVDVDKIIQDISEDYIIFFFGNIDIESVIREYKQVNNLDFFIGGALLNDYQSNAFLNGYYFGLKKKDLIFFTKNRNSRPLLEWCDFLYQNMIIYNKSKSFYTQPYFNRILKKYHSSFDNKIQEKRDVISIDHLYKRLFKIVEFDIKFDEINVEISKKNVNDIRFILHKLIQNDFRGVLNLICDKKNIRISILREVFLFNKFCIPVFQESNSKVFIRLDFNNIKNEEQSTINEWTFAIITDGRFTGRVEKQIKSIEELGVPEYEILICGDYSGYSNTHTNVIPFLEENRRDIRPWITRKKNLLVKNSKYENICILHDRITFDKIWFVNLKKNLSNSFQIVVFPVLDVLDNTYRIFDWEKFENHFLDVFRFRLLPMKYNSWDVNAMIYGGAFAIKKSIYEDIMLDERLHWSEAEDVLQSELKSLNGYFLELAKDSILYSTRHRLKGSKNSNLGYLKYYLLKSMISRRLKLILVFLKRIINRT